ncbi:MAG: HDOD domain-containing protein [Candidatus Scalindua sp. AMX11]|nr:MAG: HDOD domain-containing protein [Candidatus Scalindua sp.]NOG82411.1 HDOD domain-containing protein [Planctomycetota bacterium]RZV70233.1 MAG: HDOD domain-containing protein [Candidatus Scalindua sp. SCAELEC01]TDE64056.1 MAG: HDOD domain-containing protein [Candidatus Scalindua sp. AMX11]GJQ60120.1 MAG: signal transduction protein [Candidatus Scalindua sp.]
MRRILFVDDEANVLQGLKRMLRKMRYEWDTEYVCSGEEALDCMVKSPYDVVVSDMRMPRMDGVELLSTVMEQYPETVRIILSGHTDRDMIMKTVKCTHQFLVKPCDAETIKYTIERACKLQDLLRDEKLKKIVAGIKDLPSLPSLYGMIIDEMKSPDASIKKVGEIISQDVSMSAKVLQIVNSAYFGLPRKLTDSQQAAVYLGIETLKALVLSIHVFSSFTKEAEALGLSLTQMWKHSFTVARLAKEIARGEKADTKILEESFISGILHDIGKLILLKVPDQCSKIKNFIDLTGGSPLEAEYSVLKTSHAELGAYLLGIWGLPDRIVETIAFHHEPSKLIENIFVKLNKSSTNGGDKTASDESLVSVKSIKNYSTEFASLTAVHVANALIMQGNCTPETTTFPYLDMLFFRTLNLSDKLSGWVELYNNIVEEEE